ncbi:MAG: SRPBCC family protein [Methylobacter sp.]|uniref:SRPBCC family protein n=1 Tax=Candidatus Methylobacter titanis TaxID=3053457 RepID=A0AA43TPU6_9GAMM|nr:SRPBCC family protein [Candidatus Methylobacter titanis]MDI1292862.1 SRPBCC family protein [Candidatus Methylobacter titanis]
MKKIALFVSVLLFFFTSVASAHGPVRQKTAEKITINAPAAKVWALIKDFGDMSWHPDIVNTSIQGGNTQGATRVLTLKDGNTITEELKKYDDKKLSYTYKITEMSSSKKITHAGAEEEVPALPVTDYSASIDLTEKGGSTEVDWKAAYYRAYMNNNPPEEMNDEAANNAVKAVLEAGLIHLKALAEK